MLISVRLVHTKVGLCGIFKTAVQYKIQITGAFDTHVKKTSTLSSQSQI